ncbi:MAG: YdcF family protein [Bacteroidota bacterium]
MFFILSKTIYHLIMPSGLIVIFLLIAFFWKRRRRFFVGLALFVGLISTNPALVNEVLRAWEAPAKSYSDIPTYEVGIVLSGMRNVHKSPKDRIYFINGSDRLWQTIFLYKQGKIKKIIVSGADYIDWRGEIDTTKNDLRDALIQVGVPEEDIWLEQKSINTAGNAQFSAELLRKKYDTPPKVLLITSAFHMRRSEACFRKQGVVFDSFAADFLSKDRHRLSLVDFMPNADAMQDLEVVLKEWIGMVIYWLRGDV